MTPSAAPADCARLGLLAVALLHWMRQDQQARPRTPPPPPASPADRIPPGAPRKPPPPPQQQQPQPPPKPMPMPPLSFALYTLVHSAN
jgi:hypothetical protein